MERILLILKINTRTNNNNAVTPQNFGPGWTESFFGNWDSILFFRSHLYLNFNITNVAMVNKRKLISDSRYLLEQDEIRCGFIIVHPTPSSITIGGKCLHWLSA